MKANEPNFRRFLFVDNWVRGLIVYAGLGFLFGGFAVAGSFWRVVKFTLVFFLLLAVLHYFMLYRSVINKKLREEGKTTEVAIRETEAYVDRGVVEVLVLFPAASILGAWFFSRPFLSPYLAALLVLLSAAILAYLHAKFITPVDLPREPWRISKLISKHVGSKNS